MDAGAQSLRIRPEIEASLTYTSNAAHASAALAESDMVLNVSPRLVFNSRGGRVQLDGSFGVESGTYSRHSDASFVRPRGRIEMRSQLVERWAFLDASVVADRESADPYAARPDTVSAFNDYTTMRYRVTPYLQRQLTPRVSLLARTDHVITRRVGGTSFFDPGHTDPVRDAHEQAQRIELAMTPMPLGAELEITREDTRHRGATRSILTQTGARAIGSYAPSPQLTLSAIIGQEVSRYSLFDRTDSIAGGELRWQPSERITLDARVERRFFGTGVSVAWRHRTPFFGLELSADRRPVAQSGSHLLGAAGANVQSLLDGVLTTRFPDATQRGQLVDTIVRDLNLPETLTAPIDLYTSYAQLQESLQATALFFGRLTTVSATVYARERRRLQDVEDVLAPAALTSDNRQLGLETLATRRLSRLLTAEAGFRVSRIEGLGVRAGESTSDIVVHGGVTRLASPSTRVGLHARHQIVRSSVTSPSKETAIIATLMHRF